MALGFNNTDSQANQAPATQPQQGRRNRVNREEEEAVGFLNLRIKDAAGNTHSIRATIPLLESVKIHSALVTKAKSQGPDYVFELEGIVNLITNEEIVL